MTRTGMLNSLRFTIGAFLAFLLVTLSGCIVPGSFSGGGTIPNPQARHGKATFTFTGDNCDGPIVASVNYNGHEADPVKLQSIDFEEVGQCVGPGEGDASDACLLCYDLNLLGQAGSGPVYAAEFTYRVKNPHDQQGTGNAFICVQDNGEGANASGPDLGVIKVTSGPYRDYMKYGPIKGNAQAGTCPD